MHLKSQHLQKSQMELTIEVPPDELKPYLEKAARRISEQAKISGFRPGKAPYDVVKRQVGEMEIYNEALEEVAQKTYFAAVKQENLMTIGQPKIEVQKLAPGNPLVYKATVSLLPKVTIANLRKIKVKGKPIEIKEEKIEDTLKGLRKMRAKEALVNRPAQNNDKVIIDLDMFVDKVPIEGGQTKNHTVYLAEEYYVPGFADQVAGMEKDAVKEFILPFPKKHYNKNLAGKDVEFRVKLNDVYEVSLPELDDEFAKSLKFNSLEKLKEQLRQNLEMEAKHKEEQRVEGEIFEALIKESAFDDIPESLIEAEAHKMLHELEDNVAAQGMKFDDYLNSIKKTEQDLKEEFIDQAEKRVKSALVTRELAEQENIDVADKEVEEETKKIFEMYKHDPASQEQIKKEDHKEYLRNVLRNRKVVEWLKRRVLGDG